MKRVVINGATSMIGIALIEECIKNNINVVGLVRSNSLKTHLIPNSNLVSIYECDLNNIDDFNNNNIEDCDVFFHIAWSYTDHLGRNDPYLQYTNIKSTLDSVKLAKNLGCTKYIGVGSQAEYNFNSDNKINPYTSYGVCKYASSILAQTLADQLDIGFVWTRIFSVYGINDNKSTLIMYLIDQLLKAKKPLLTKCEQRWDYLFSQDCGRALYLIGEFGKNKSIYDIGSGKAHPLIEYVLILRNLIDSNLELGIGEKEYNNNQIMNLCADISNLTEDTGFVPNVSFNNGIRQTIDWYKNVVL